MLDPFKLDGATLDLLRQIDGCENAVGIEYRAKSAHALIRQCPWAVVYFDDSRTGKTLAIANSEAEARQELADLLQAFKQRKALEDLGVERCRYEELMTEVYGAATDLYLDIEHIPGLEFVKAWLEISDSSAATWLFPSPEQVAPMVGRMAARHGPMPNRR